MASTRKSLAGQAASAARKVMSRRSTKTADEPVRTAPPTKAAATKVPARKPAAKKAAPPAKKAAPAAKKAPATRTVSVAKKAAPAKKAPPAKKAAPVKKAAPTAKRAPAKKAPATQAVSAAAKTAPAKKAPATKAVSVKNSPAKKATPVKKAPASALAVKEGEGAWTKAELAEVLDELHGQRTHSSSIIEKLESELFGLMRDAGDGAGHDQADMGATSFERDQELIVLNNERDKLAQIERALARIDNGTYGVCESCGNPIGKMRAMAFPRATLCMTCKQREERR